MTRHKLDDSIWNKIYAYLKITPGIYTGNEDKSHPFVNVVHWIMRTGTEWRDLPCGSGKWNTIYKRFARWSDKGIWKKLHEHFIEDPDMD